MSHLRANPSAGLFLDMGLGKTAAALSALTPEHLPALVVAPKRVAEHVWPEESSKWRSDLTVAVAAGSPVKRQAALQSGADIVVIGRDNLKDAVPYARRFNTFIMDELSSFKHRSSGRWRVARAICREVRFRWGLTGTPAANGLMDLWAQLYLLDEGKRLYPTITAFRTRYFFPGRVLPNGVVSKWELRPGADKRIHQLIEDICLSMSTEGRVELPPVTLNRVAVPLPPGAVKFYRSMARDLVANLDLLGLEGIRTASTAGAMTMKLSQITAGFVYDDPEQYLDGDGRNLRPADAWTPLHREKLDALAEIIEGTGSPVLVFYRFLPEKAGILKEFGDRAHTIDEPGVIERWNRGEVPILLAHPASAGHGLNLQHGGHTIVWTTPDFDLELWEQGNKRLARSGQKHPVVIHVLETPRSVDTLALMRLEGKADVQNALLSHLESPL